MLQLSCVQIDDVVIDFTQSVIFSTDAPNKKIELDERSLKLFELLLSSPNFKAGRNELLSKIWVGKVVSDDSLTNLVSQTRQRIKPISKSLIKTIPKKGYSLVGSVTHLDETQVSTSIFPKEVQRPLAKKYTPIVSLVISVSLLIIFLGYLHFSSQYNKSDQTVTILPIKLISDDETLNNKVAIFNQILYQRFVNMPGISVTPKIESERLSSLGLSLNQLFEELNARYLLESNVRVDDDIVIVVVNFIDAKTQDYVFSRTLKSPLSTFIKKAEKILQPISRMVVSEVSISSSLVTLDSNSEWADEKCNVYLSLAELYANDTLDDVTNIASPAEDACIHLSQLHPNTPEKMGKVAQLYSFMARASREDRALKLSFIELAESYLEKTFNANESDRFAYELQAELFVSKLQDEMNNGEIKSDIFDSKLVLLENAISYYPTNSTLLNVKGKILRYRGIHKRRRGNNPKEDFEQARAALDSLLQVEPQNHAAWEQLGLVFMAKAAYNNDIGISPIDNLTLSVEHYRKAIQLDDKIPHYHRNLADSASVLGGILAERGEEFEAMFALAENSLLRLKQISQNPFGVESSLADLYRREAKALFERGVNPSEKLANGIAHNQRGIDLNPDYVWARFSLMELHRMSSYYDYSAGKNYSPHIKLCLEVAETGIAMKSDSARAWFSYIDCQQLNARMYIENSQLKAAAVLLKNIENNIKKMAMLDENYPKLHILKGVNSLLLARISNSPNFFDAISSFNKALELQHSKQEGRLQLVEAMLYHLATGSSETSFQYNHLEMLLSGAPSTLSEKIELTLLRAIYDSLTGKTVNFSVIKHDLNTSSELLTTAAFRKYQLFTQ